MKYQDKFKQKVGIYVGITLLLLLLFYITRDVTWSGSKETHTLMELLATILALFVGILALIRYYTKKNNTFLFLGAGFIGTAFLDGYHTIITSTYFEVFLPSVPEALIPWSWSVSRFFLATIIFISWIVWKREKALGRREIISERAVYIGVGLFAFTSSLFFSLFPLPSAYYPELYFGRPEELGAAIIFLLAIIGYISKGWWRKHSFDHWIILFLIFSFMGQVLFMSFSFELFDTSFDIAHALKIISYLLILTGLLISMFFLFRKAEEGKKILENQAKELTRIDKMKTEFVSVASHQLRTPLTAVKLFVEMLRGGKVGKLNERQTEYMTDISASTERMIGLVNDLLNVSQLETGKLKIKPELINLENLIKEIIEDTAALSESKGSTIHFESKGKEVGEVMIDPNLLRQVIFNLLSNSIRYSKSNGKIVVTLENKESNYVITVEDDGIGIPKEAQKKIFERFYRAENAQALETVGSGLGMYIAKMIIDAFNGKITFKSTEGKGTTFCITMPKHQQKSKKVEYRKEVRVA